MVETEIDASNTWFLQKLADGESAAAATAYEEHAVLLPRVGEAIRGRRAIEIFWPSGRLVAATRDSFNREPSPTSTSAWVTRR